MFADIIVDIKHEKLDRIFQYRIPEWLKEELNVGGSMLLLHMTARKMQKH